MALFEYFPNYIWNLSVAIAMESGGQIGEIVDMCKPIRDAAASGADAGTPEFMKQWSAMGEKLINLAAEDERRGRAFSASNKLERASLYLITAERMQGHGHPGRGETYAKALAAFEQSTRLGELNRERIEIPLKYGFMPALYTRATGPGPHPVVVYCNGLDSCKELLYWSRLPEALARRGISTLCVDQPGSGEALRLQGLPVDPHSEHWATKAVDWLEAQVDVDPERIGMTGISLGGHFAPRAVAYEPRFASGAVWGANHNWREVQDQRLKREGENPVPHYWAHVMWAFGASDMDDFLAK
ncbi:MAG: alpha/beta hydrolase, partial [Sphingomonadales bacterium 39-62-4]